MTAEETTAAKRKNENSSNRFQDYLNYNPPGKKIKLEHKGTVFSVNDAKFHCPLCQFPAKKYSTLQVHLLDHFDVNWEENCDEKEQKDLLCKAEDVLNWFCIHKPSRRNEGEKLQKTSNSEASLALELTAKRRDVCNRDIKQDFVQFTDDADVTDETFQETAIEAAIVHRQHNTDGVFFNAPRESFMNTPKHAQTPTLTHTNQSNSSQPNELGGVHPAFYNRDEPSQYRNEGVKGPCRNCRRSQCVDDQCLVGRSLSISGNRYAKHTRSFGHEETAETLSRVNSESALPSNATSMQPYTASYPQFSTKTKHLPSWSDLPDRRPVPSSLHAAVSYDTHNVSQQAQMRLSYGSNHRSPARCHIPTFEPTAVSSIQTATVSSNRKTDNELHTVHPVSRTSTVASHPPVTSTLLRKTSRSTKFTRLLNSGRANSNTNTHSCQYPSCSCSLNQNCSGTTEDMEVPTSQNALPLDQRPAFMMKVANDQESSRTDNATFLALSRDSNEPMDLTLCKNQTAGRTLPQGNTYPNQFHLQRETCYQHRKIEGNSKWENRNSHYPQTSPGYPITAHQTAIPLNSDTQQQVMHNNDIGIGWNETGSTNEFSRCQQRPGLDNFVHHVPFETGRHSQQYCIQKPEARNHTANTVCDWGSNPCSLNSSTCGHQNNPNDEHHHTPINELWHETSLRNCGPQTSIQNSCQVKLPQNISHLPVTECHCHQRYMSSQCGRKCWSPEPIAAATTGHHMFQGHRHTQVKENSVSYSTRMEYPPHSCPQGNLKGRSLSEPSVAADRNTTGALEPYNQELRPKEFHGHCYAPATVHQVNDVPTVQALPPQPVMDSLPRIVGVSSLKTTQAIPSMLINLTGQTPVSRKHPMIADLLLKPGPKPNPTFDAFKTIPGCSLQPNAGTSFTGYNLKALDRGIPSPTPMASITCNQNTLSSLNHDSSPFASPPLAETHNSVRKEQQVNVTLAPIPVPSHYRRTEFSAARRNRLPTTVSISRYRCTLCGMIGNSSSGMRRHGSTHNGFIPKLHLVEIDCI